MNEHRLFQFERQVENTIEGLFSQILGRGQRFPRPQEMALAIGRAMEEGVQHSTDGQPLAPEQYMLHLYPAYVDHLNRSQLAALLAEQIRQLAAFHGYTLETPPQVIFQPSAALSPRELHVDAHFQALKQASTVAMEPVTPPPTAPLPNAHLLVGDRPFSLSSPLVTIGRSRDNTLVLDDPHASRHHAQIRLRAGIYMLFDTQSGSGTLVNGVMVKEHRLQSGDVIRIGRTALVYIDDSGGGIDMTDAFEPEAQRDGDA